MLLGYVVKTTEIASIEVCGEPFSNVDSIFFVFRFSDHDCVLEPIWLLLLHLPSESWHILGNKITSPFGRKNAGFLLHFQFKKLTL